ncbi:MAG: DUF4920 domain-containing protein [Bacteroidota bacterium]|nr:DUF4920 domain-containing protein [Bacteroidota bacterium]
MHGRNKNIATEISSQADYYGNKIDESGSIAAPKIKNLLEENDSLQLKVEGAVIEVCQKKGCWMNVDIGGGETMKVVFKDYEFFVPLDVAGKSAILEGVAKKEITSVATLRHYAEDAGKSKEEILAITKPEKKIVFEAEGVILK